MTYLPAYVQIEGTWHEIAEDEKTVCGLAIPYPGTLLTRDAPDKVHCGAQATTGKSKIAQVAEKAEANRLATLAKKPAAKAKAKK